MTTIMQPRTNVVIVPSSEPAQNTGQKILFIGQKTSAGTAPTGELIERIENGGAEDALFGENSMLATLIRANKVRNQQVQIDVIALDDAGAAVMANGSITFTGTATEAGDFEVVVASQRNHSYSISVVIGDTAAIIGDKVVAAVTADTRVPVTAQNTDGLVAFAAVNGGTYGNSLPLGVSGIVAGMTTSVTGMTNGGTDPTLTGVFDPVAGARYQAVVWPYPEDTAELTGFLDPRFNADGVVLDGVGFTALNDTLGNLTSLASALNSQSLVIFGGKLENEPANYVGGDIVEIPMVKASVFAGYRGLRLDVDRFNVADLVITANGPLDSFGGPALASKPYFNTPFADMFPVKSGRGFDDTDIEDLHDAGVSVLGNNIAANGIIAGEVVTTYKTDFAGNEDITFKYLNYVDTSSQAREYRYNNLRKRFAQSRLTEGDTLLGRDMANELTVRSFMKRLYEALAGVEYVLVEAGEDALKFYEANLVIMIDKAEGRVTVQETTPIVTQLREIFVTTKIVFSVNP